MFRRQLSFIPIDGVRDWRLVLCRIGDLPIEVNAAVQRVPDVGPTGSGALHWVVRLAEDHAADRRD